ncbi:tellurium resistance protein TerC [Candidatus Gottesmanbacteria bacterium]|nr:tellurium resistance protein TerC [Candidatus Gottesmanbacteria bacterium]
MSSFPFAYLVIILQLVMIEGLLSLDNAAILGTLVANLPTTPIPLPKFLNFCAPFLHRHFNNQRFSALKVGILGAYLGRGLMLLAANFIIYNPWLKIISALYLLKLFFAALSKREFKRHQHPKNVSSLQTFWRVVLTVELTDLAFSVDNVIAAVALSNKIWLVVTGVVIGITIMRFAAQFFTVLVNKQPEFKNIAYLLVLNFSLEILIEEFLGVKFGDFTRFFVSLLTIAGSLIYLRLTILHFLNPILFRISQFMGKVDNLGEKIFSLA